MSSFVNVLMDINLLFFSFSFIFYFIKINDEPYYLFKRLTSLKNIFYLKKLKTKEEKWNNILFFVVLTIFTLLMISYFCLFNIYVLENYDDRFWYIFRLSFTPIIFLILPVFFPKILENLIFGFFPKDVENFDRLKIKRNKYDFIMNWLFFIGILIGLTLLISWEINIIWLSFLIISIIILLVLSRITSSKFFNDI
jgi:hypothetical protein